MEKLNGRIEGLDLIRGIAIGLVIVRHAWPSQLGGAGIVGVVLFFALSGYLITGLLVNDVRSYGNIRYGRFYLHRAIRLVPPLLFMLLGFTVVSLAFDPLGDRATLSRSLTVAILYISDVPGFTKGSSALGHLWTLAAEEQFYLVWPLVLLVGIRRRCLGGLTVLAAASLYIACAASLIAVAPDYYRAYTLPTSWSTAMAIGALARIFEARLVATVFATASRRKVLAVVGLLVLAGLSVVSVDLKSLAVSYLLLGPLIGVVAVALVFWMRQWVRVPRYLRPLLFLGTISYAAYLWNFPIQAWVDRLQPSLLGGGIAIPLTIAAASVSWFVVEKPIGRLRRGLDARIWPPRSSTVPATNTSVSVGRPSV